MQIVSDIFFVIASIIRKVYRYFCFNDSLVDKNNQGGQYYGYVDMFDQEANDYIFNLLSIGRPCLIAKFGTYELAALEEFRSINQSYYSLRDYIDYILLRRNRLHKETDVMSRLCSNAGFFPKDRSLLSKYYEINLIAIKNIDVLGSYQINEYVFRDDLKNSKKVNLNGYYAPFLFDNPWTKILKGKRVLVVHPFAQDIQNQYKRRKYLWGNEDILPEFDLIVYKSIQSMLDIECGYNDWFEALESMESDINKLEFDIAIVGCGAYGLPLSSYIKTLGKQVIHLAGWTQVLFGIVGKRWENNSEVKPFINKYWIHPSKNETPKDSKEIENGCYW